MPGIVSHGPASQGSHGNAATGFYNDADSACATKTKTTIEKAAKTQASAEIGVCAMIQPDKWCCPDCEWVGPADHLDDQLTLARDFDHPAEYENLCPVCGSDRVEEYDPIICSECEEPDCECEAESFFEDYPEYAAVSIK